MNPSDSIDFTVIHSSQRLFYLLAAILLVSIGRTEAVIYTVDRSWTDVIFPCSLTGTVDIPLGTYTIENRGASPFTSIDLTLGANGHIYHLTSVLTDKIYGTAQFIINATTTSLIFTTAYADGSDPADLAFSDNWLPPYRNNYEIGSDESAGFEGGYVAGADLYAPVSFPVVFGAAVPEPLMSGIFPTAILVGAVFQWRRTRLRGA